ncbi:MAG TPA: hypothetical protein VMN57_15170 [Anaerolineales bacterium]|nr:hypothetical protein [Anaerolineales bacterium]
MAETGAKEFAAGLRSDAVSNATGKGWREWFSILDQAGAARLPHTDISRFLHESQGLSSWWSRTVTVGYEQTIGRRTGLWAGESQVARVRRSFSVPVPRLYRAWADEAQRVRWLPGQPILIRKAIPEESLRITWSDNVSGVNVRFGDDDPLRSRVQVEHVRLRSEDQVRVMAAYWETALERLDRFLHTT